MSMSYCVVILSSVKQMWKWINQHVTSIEVCGLALHEFSVAQTDRVPALCLGGHRFESCWGICTFFLCSTLVTYWLIHFHNKMQLVKFACIVHVMVYFGWPEKVLMAKIYVACFGFKNKDYVFQIPSILQYCGNRLILNLIVFQTIQNKLRSSVLDIF